jgi:colanic acid biosynthesis protein WcaH
MREKVVTKFLDKQQFLEVVKLTPLVSIDLVVKNSMGEVLLGLRMNEPARDTWFVPGGRICKDERIEQAFNRISRSELGIPLNIGDAHPMGVFEHLYDRNFAQEPEITTHYIVLAYAIKLDLPLEMMPKDQHQLCRWWKVDELRAAADVHQNTKAYFISSHNS